MSSPTTISRRKNREKTTAFIAPMTVSEKRPGISRKMATSGTTSYTTNNLNQYTNIASQVPSYDNNGNLTNINGWTYTYDAQNRLLSAGNGTTTETFAYDPQNRCVSRTLNGTTTNFLYDGWNLIEELDGSGAELAYYVHGVQNDEMLYKATTASTVFYHQDALGNVTTLSDNSGNLVEHYTYDVFGAPSIYNASGGSLTASAYGNRFLFTGREYLQEVGLYDYRNRVYSAVLGRFLQTDPIRFAADDVNIYRYVGNSATNTGDLLGLWYNYAPGNYDQWNKRFSKDWNNPNFRKKWLQNLECPDEHDVDTDDDPDANAGIPPGLDGSPDRGRYDNESDFLRALEAYALQQKYQYNRDGIPDQELFQLNEYDQAMQEFNKKTAIVNDEKNLARVMYPMLMTAVAPPLSPWVEPAVNWLFNH